MLKPTCPRKTKKAGVHGASPVGGNVEELWRKRLVEKISFEPRVLTNIESCQQRFTKKIRGLANMTYQEQSCYLGLESRQVRRIRVSVIY